MNSINQHIVPLWKNVVRQIHGRSPIPQDDEDASLFHQLYELVLTGWLPEELMTATTVRATHHPVRVLYTNWMMWLTTGDQQFLHNLSNRISRPLLNLTPLLLEPYGDLLLPEEQTYASRIAQYVSDTLEECVQCMVSFGISREVAQRYLPMQIAVPLAFHYRFYLHYAFNLDMWEPNHSFRQRELTQLARWLCDQEEPMKAFDLYIACPEPVVTPRIMKRLILEEIRDADT